VKGINFFPPSVFFMLEDFLRERFGRRVVEEEGEEPLYYEEEEDY